MDCSLRTIKGHGRGREYPLKDQEVLIGRDSSRCGIVIRDPAVGRNHATLTFDGGHWFIEDLNSRNHTYVNGQEITSRRRLEHGDRISVCDTVFVFSGGAPCPSEDSSDSSLSVVWRADASTSTDVLRAEPERRLRALVHIDLALSKALELDAVLDLTITSLLEIFPQASHGLILLREGPDLVPKAWKSRDPGGGLPLFSRTVSQQAMADRRAVLIEALGVDADWPYQTRSARLNPGESVVLYSDGVVDAMDRLGTRFGVPRTRETLRLARALSPEELVETLLARVHQHRGSCEQNDDISMVVFRRNALCSGARA